MCAVSKCDNWSAQGVTSFGDFLPRNETAYLPELQSFAASYSSFSPLVFAFAFDSAPAFNYLFSAGMELEDFAFFF